MAGNYGFSMDQENTKRHLVAMIGSFLQDRLLDKELRTQQKEQCAERLAAEDGTNDKDMEVGYSDQAVLANLDWGIDALDEAINTSNIETKLARLDYAEKMLQVCAMLNSGRKTAGVPNYYLSAWAHLNLAYLWKLKNNPQSAVLHILEMFHVDPFFSRIDFAPELWRDLFLPHMSAIVGWYTQERRRLVMEVIPDSSDLSMTVDFDQCFSESLIFSLRPDQAEKVQKLEELYGQSLDENTKLYAKYYRDCMMNVDSTNGKVIPMMPIVEAPMTPLHEVSRSIPDFIKFGPILPKSAGFSPMMKHRGDVREEDTSPRSSRSWRSSTTMEDDQENGDESDKEREACEDSEFKSHRLVPLNSFRMNNYDGTNLNPKSKESNSRRHSPLHSPTTPSSKNSKESNSRRHSPLHSPTTPSPKNSPSERDGHHQKNSVSMLRLLSTRAAAEPTINSPSLVASPQLREDSSNCSLDSDCESTGIKRGGRRKVGYEWSTDSENVASQEQRNSSFLSGSDEGNYSCASLPLSEKLSQARPKDFVCPITGQIFDDPVTLETGQTYERKAIEEWMNRGNTTCPITRQLLTASTLPKTNYVLKRLITTWKEQNPDLVLECSYAETPRSSLSHPSSKETSTPSRVYNSPSNNRRRTEYSNSRLSRFMRETESKSPTSVISQAALETIINGLEPHITCLCNSEDLQECEAAVLTIVKKWKDAKGDPGLHSFLSKPTITNSFMEILTASMNREILGASVYILSELIFADDGAVVETLTNVNSDFDCLASLLKNGLAHASVLIYLLRPTYSQLSSQDLVPSLVQLILMKSDDFEEFQLVMEPKDASIIILDQLLTGGDENSRVVNAKTVVDANTIPVLVQCLERTDVRQSVISILFSCMLADKSCKNLIASKIELSLVLELFHSGNDGVKGLCIDFLYELVQQNRRTSCNQILQIIKDEREFSIMHIFLVYLQMAPMDQQPSLASLLLQLDLLVDPRKMSIYREEAIDALIEALLRKEFPNFQAVALDSILFISGRLTPSGKPCAEAWLLKIAGYNQAYDAMMKIDIINRPENERIMVEDEEKVARSWEKKVAFVLCNHDKGVIFKALEECLKSTSLVVAKSCLVSATWLVYMLYRLPDTGIRDVARKYLLHQFINVIQSSKNIEEKILAAIALRSFINDASALKDIGMYARCIYKALRKLKKNCKMIKDILKALINSPTVNPAELWSCSEVAELDSCINGEVLSLLHLRGRLISSHSDGTIKVWNAGKKVPHLIQEVCEHAKAVTCLYVPSSSNKLYSGSLDKTIRVWSIEHDGIHCIQVHDVKDPVHNLIANADVACFSSHGIGVKIYNWIGVPKHINFNKSVKSLAASGSKLYCGCSGYSIQEVDLCDYTSCTFYSGTRKLLGKQIIHSIYAQNGHLISGGSSVDGSAGKVFSLSSKSVMGSLSTGHDIHQIAVNNDFIFAATKLGTVEVWLKEGMERVASINTVMGVNGNVKLVSLVADRDGDMLFAGFSDGKIRVWSLD